ncbi:NUDIX hydrolase [Bacillus salitolerans]|uniref:NUDIX hydrolase n=1 Tax=Bacillus salitolerans TaxID=1437434 RepID=A0ABW4LUY1_9BACI
MKEWCGSAAICINGNEILMVRENGSDKWAIPSGGMEKGETPEQCCLREMKEETGYDVRIVEKLFVKETVIKGIDVKTYYFIVEKNGESEGINDPDNTIVETRWLSAPELKNMPQAYPEDLERLLSLLS